MKSWTGSRIWVRRRSFGEMNLAVDEKEAADFEEENLREISIEDDEDNHLLQLNEDYYGNHSAC